MLGKQWGHMNIIHRMLICWGKRGEGAHEHNYRRHICWEKGGTKSYIQSINLSMEGGRDRIIISLAQGGNLQEVYLLE